MKRIFYDDSLLKKLDEYHSIRIRSIACWCKRTGTLRIDMSEYEERDGETYPRDGRDPHFTTILNKYAAIRYAIRFIDDVRAMRVDALQD
jgi:hypothetical protein